MLDQNGNGPITLKPDQLRVLEEIVLFGGVQIVRHMRNHAHYAELLKKKLIEAIPLSKKETRYNITFLGRLFISSQT
jgi:hypothetical protein